DGEGMSGYSHRVAVPNPTVQPKIAANGRHWLASGPTTVQAHPPPTQQPTQGHATNNPRVSPLPRRPIRDPDQPPFDAGLQSPYANNNTWLDSASPVRLGMFRVASPSFRVGSHVTKVREVEEMKSRTEQLRRETASLRRTMNSFSPEAACPGSPHSPDSVAPPTSASKDKETAEAIAKLTDLVSDLRTELDEVRRGNPELRAKAASTESPARRGEDTSATDRAKQPAETLDSLRQANCELKEKAREQDKSFQTVHSDKHDLESQLQHACERIQRLESQLKPSRGTPEERSAVKLQLATSQQREALLIEELAESRRSVQQLSIRVQTLEDENYALCQQVNDLKPLQQQNASLKAVLESSQPDHRSATDSLHSLVQKEVESHSLPQLHTSAASLAAATALSQSKFRGLGEEVGCTSRASSADNDAHLKTIAQADDLAGGAFGISSNQGSGVNIDNAQAQSRGGSVHAEFARSDSRSSRDTLPHHVSIASRVTRGDIVIRQSANHSFRSDDRVSVNQYMCHRSGARGDEPKLQSHPSVPSQNDGSMATRQPSRAELSSLDRKGPPSANAAPLVDDRNRKATSQTSHSAGRMSQNGSRRSYVERRPLHDSYPGTENSGSSHFKLNTNEGMQPIEHCSSASYQHRTQRLSESSKKSLDGSEHVKSQISLGRLSRQQPASGEETEHLSRKSEQCDGRGSFESCRDVPQQSAVAFQAGTSASRKPTPDDRSASEIGKARHPCDQFPVSQRSHTSATAEMQDRYDSRPSSHESKQTGCQLQPSEHARNTSCKDFSSCKSGNPQGSTSHPQFPDHPSCQDLGATSTCESDINEELPTRQRARTKDTSQSSRAASGNETLSNKTDHHKHASSNLNSQLARHTNSQAREILASDERPSSTQGSYVGERQVGKSSNLTEVLHHVNQPDKPFRHESTTPKSEHLSSPPPSNCASAPLVVEKNEQPWSASHVSDRERQRRMSCGGEVLAEQSSVTSHQPLVVHGSHTGRHPIADVVSVRTSQISARDRRHSGSHHAYDQVSERRSSHASDRSHRSIKLREVRRTSHASGQLLTEHESRPGNAPLSEHVSHASEPPPQSAPLEPRASGQPEMEHSSRAGTERFSQESGYKSDNGEDAGIVTEQNSRSNQPQDEHQNQVSNLPFTNQKCASELSIDRLSRADSRIIEEHQNQVSNLPSPNQKDASELSIDRLSRAGSRIIEEPQAEHGSHLSNQKLGSQVGDRSHSSHTNSHLTKHASEPPAKHSSYASHQTDTASSHASGSPEAELIQLNSRKSAVTQKSESSSHEPARQLSHASHQTLNASKSPASDSLLQDEPSIQSKQKLPSVSHPDSHLTERSSHSSDRPYEPSAHHSSHANNETLSANQSHASQSQSEHRESEPVCRDDPGSEELPEQRSNVNVQSLMEGQILANAQPLTHDQVFSDCESRASTQLLREDSNMPGFPERQSDQSSNRTTSEHPDLAPVQHVAEHARKESKQLPAGHHSRANSDRSSHDTESARSVGIAQECGIRSVPQSHVGASSSGERPDSAEIESSKSSVASQKSAQQLASVRSRRQLRSETSTKQLSSRGSHGDSGPEKLSQPLENPGKDAMFRPTSASSLGSPSEHRGEEAAQDTNEVQVDDVISPVRNSVSQSDREERSSTMDGSDAHNGRRSSKVSRGSVSASEKISRPSAKTVSCTSRTSVTETVADAAAGGTALSDPLAPAGLSVDRSQQSAGTPGRNTVAADDSMSEELPPNELSGEKPIKTHVTMSDGSEGSMHEKEALPQTQSLSDVTESDDPGFPTAIKTEPGTSPAEVVAKEQSAHVDHAEDRSESKALRTSSQPLTVNVAARSRSSDDSVIMLKQAVPGSEEVRAQPNQDGNNTAGDFLSSSADLNTDGERPSDSLREQTSHATQLNMPAPVLSRKSSNASTHSAKTASLASRGEHSNTAKHLPPEARAMLDPLADAETLTQQESVDSLVRKPLVVSPQESAECKTTSSEHKSETESQVDGHTESAQAQEAGSSPQAGQDNPQPSVVSTHSAPPEEGIRTSDAPSTPQAPGKGDGDALNILAQGQNSNDERPPHHLDPQPRSSSPPQLPQSQSSFPWQQSSQPVLSQCVSKASNDGISGGSQLSQPLVRISPHSTTQRSNTSSQAPGPCSRESVPLEPPSTSSTISQVQSSLHSHQSAVPFVLQHVSRTPPSPPVDHELSRSSIKHFEDPSGNDRQSMTPSRASDSIPGFPELQYGSPPNLQTELPLHAPATEDEPAESENGA
ncbi:hypothetical protein DIPPA_02083, partial [Diplonema papillatum]